MSHRLRLAPLLLAAAGLAPALTAGTVKVSGFLEPAPGQLCPQAGAWRIRDTAVSILDTNVNLAPFSGKNVTIVGADVAAACPVVDAQSVAFNGTYLFLCGSPGIGCEVSLDLCPAPFPASVWMFGSFGTAYLPVDPGAGTFLLDPASLFTFFVLPQLDVCQATRFFVPALPAAVGATAYFQAAVVQGGNVSLSNVTSMTIEGPQLCPYFECF